MKAMCFLGPQDPYLRPVALVALAREAMGPELHPGELLLSENEKDGLTATCEQRSVEVLR